MAGRFRILRVAKWTGLGSCAALVGLWVVSAEFAFLIEYETRQCTRIGVQFGELYASRIVGQPSGMTIPNSEWTVIPAVPKIPFETRWGMRSARITSDPIDVDSPGATLRNEVLVVPIWISLLVFAIPTAFFWHRDWRRIPAGHCGRCGYDLTKNESGVCPECGVAIHGRTSVSVSPGRGRPVE